MRISREYLAQQQALHQNPHYGVASIHYAPLVAELISKFAVSSVADYGAGKRNLHKKLKELGHDSFKYFPYDPVFPEYGEPKSADLVCCIDVLEHVEPDCLTDVLTDLSNITSKLGLYTVHTGPAIKHLPDGRNAHLIQQPTSWWLPKLCQHFEIAHLQSVPEGFWVVVEPKQVH